MKRLVYVPQVNAWVKTDLGVVDLSPYIVRGNVNRKVDQISSAELTFRNPRKLFTEYRKPDNTVGPVMYPQDPIIITLTRLRGRPIQVFTGYLDRSPYLQLYPGTVSLSASCTLKRLQYTYWDPGLDFTIQFLKSYGWYPDQAHGGISAPQAEIKDLKQVDQFNDGSIANLLKAVLTNIGGWNEKNIYIEPLPKTIGPLVVRLFEQFKQGDEENKEIMDAYEDLLTQIVGTASYGGGGGGNTPGGFDPGVEPADLKDFPRDKYQYTKTEVLSLLRAYGFKNELRWLDVLWCESKYIRTNWSKLDALCCWGLWQINCNVHPLSKEQACDPVVATAYSYKLSKGGTYFYPWDCATGRR